MALKCQLFGRAPASTGRACRPGGTGLCGVGQSPRKSTARTKFGGPYADELRRARMTLESPNWVGQVAVGRWHTTAKCAILRLSDVRCGQCAEVVDGSERRSTARFAHFAEFSSLENSTFYIQYAPKNAFWESAREAKWAQMSSSHPVAYKKLASRLNIRVCAIAVRMIP